MYEFLHLQELLGADLDTLKRLCDGDMEALDALDALDAAVKGAGHPGERNDLVDIINKVSEDDAGRPTGTSRAYALRRLRSERPDLHE